MLEHIFQMIEIAHLLWYVPAIIKFVVQEFGRDENTNDVIMKSNSVNKAEIHIIQ